MIKAILAGFMIAMGAGLYLTVGGPVGAFLFSVGLLTILKFGFYLFTGKAGLLATKEIKWWQLVLIWCGNLVGTACGALLLNAAGLGLTVVGPATAIIMKRIGNTWFENVLLGILCGVLMYIAVKGFKDMPYLTIMCVASFILLGANHCVADMVYMFLSGVNWNGLVSIFFTTLGNIIGCNLIGVGLRLAGIEENKGLL